MVRDERADDRRRQGRLRPGDRMTALCYPHVPDETGRRCELCGAPLPIFRAPA